MFNISKRSQLGLYVMVELAKQPGTQRSADDLAQTLEVSGNHLAKVLQVLARNRWIRGTRGAGGGYELAGNVKSISMADVIELFEGPPNMESCALLEAGEDCSGQGSCEIKHVMREIDEQAYYTLKSVTIHLLANPPGHRPVRKTGLRLV